MTGGTPEHVVRAIWDMRATSSQLDTFDIAEQVSRKLGIQVTETTVHNVLAKGLRLMPMRAAQ